MNILQKIALSLPVATLCLIAGSCSTDENSDNWDTYKEWREANIAFYEEQQYSLSPEGENYYQSLTPVWNNSAQILIRYLNDRRLTEGNLSPLLTSTVSVKYKGWLYNDIPFDSSYTQTDSVYTTTPNTLIQGWTIALLNMRVGDSVRVVIPYTLGYGSMSQGVIPPYSTLVFDMKLVDIPNYEIQP